jgi:tRNA-specific 2-thiouridylase
LSQEALSKTLFPLGEMTKKEVRALAKKHGLKTANIPESREICFVADDDYHRFLKEWEDKRSRTFSEGNIVRSDGTILGKHQGIEFYTIGQRKGLGISNPTPLYVNDLRSESNEVVVGDNDELYKTTCTISGINWVAIPEPANDFKADVKIRYLHKASPAIIKPLSRSKAAVTFKEPARAITPGQSAVFYYGDIVLGGGFID